MLALAFVIQEGGSSKSRNCRLLVFGFNISIDDLPLPPLWMAWGDRSSLVVARLKGSYPVGAATLATAWKFVSAFGTCR
jgi:hypothetical protein